MNENLLSNYENDESNFFKELLDDIKNRKFLSKGSTFGSSLILMISMIATGYIKKKINLINE